MEKFLSWDFALVTILVLVLCFVLCLGSVVGSIVDFVWALSMLGSKTITLHSKE